MKGWYVHFLCEKMFKMLRGGLCKNQPLEFPWKTEFLYFFSVTKLPHSIKENWICMFDCWPRYFFPFPLFFFHHIFFLHIGLFPFIHTAAPLQHHKVLQDDLYSSLHLWSDLWPVFCTCHLKLADTHKASVIVCLPELSLDCWFILQKIWKEMLKKTLANCLLMDTF